MICIPLNHIAIATKPEEINKYQHPKFKTFSSLTFFFCFFSTSLSKRTLAVSSSQCLSATALWVLDHI